MICFHKGANTRGVIGELLVVQLLWRKKIREIYSVGSAVSLFFAPSLRLTFDKLGSFERSGLSREQVKLLLTQDATLKTRFLLSLLSDETKVFNCWVLLYLQSS